MNGASSSEALPETDVVGDGAAEAPRASDASGEASRVTPEPSKSRGTGTRQPPKSAGTGRGWLGAVELRQQHGEYGEQYVWALASAWGVQPGTPDKRDRLKADVSLTLEGLFQGRLNPVVWAQVKCTASPKFDATGSLVYEVDTASYEVLRDPRQDVARALIVVVVPFGDRLAKVSHRRTVLLRSAYWCDPLHWGPPKDRQKQSVSLPASNLLTREAMEEMITTLGTNRTTPVPQHVLDRFSATGGPS